MNTDPAELSIVRSGLVTGMPYLAQLMRYQCHKATEQAQAQYEAYRRALSRGLTV